MSTDDPTRRWRDELVAALAEIEHAHMPFGRFGPANFPPRGVPLYDLPAAYLQFFAAKGFPRGRLGELMSIVYQLKMDGADRAFEPMRARHGGRTRLVPKRT
jgi:uncharacterized protein (DUF3820 family)